LAPTAPDSLWCQPYSGFDPFIIQELPDVYFVGNQPKFQTEMVTIGSKSVRIILIPDFELTSSLVVLESGNMDCTEIEFDIELK
jgi:DNA polymerase delta subunit 2